MQKVEVVKRSTLTGHRDAVYTLASAATPHHFFSAAGDGMVVRWDLRHPDEGEVIAKVPRSVYALHYLPQFQHLVVGQNFEGIHLLDTTSKKELASLQLTQAAIFDILLAGPDLLVATGEGTVVVVDREKWVVKKKIKVSEKNVRTLAVNDQTGELAVGSSDGWIRLYDLEGYTPRGGWQAHQNSVFSLAYTPNRQFLLSASRDARLKAWAAGKDGQLEKEVVAHLFAVNHMAFSPDGKHFVTCSMDKSIKVWDTFDLQLLKVIDKARHAGHGTSVNKLLWTSFDNQLVSASDDRTLSVWNLFFKLQPI
ncbi:MAG: WD40 repeat domain-containing protein [Bacteroidota bacterium]